MFKESVSSFHFWDRIRQGSANRKRTYRL